MAEDACQHTSVDEIGCVVHDVGVVGQQVVAGVRRVRHVADITPHTDHLQTTWTETSTTGHDLRTSRRAEYLSEDGLTAGMTEWCSKTGRHAALPVSHVHTRKVISPGQASNLHVANASVHLNSSALLSGQCGSLT